MSLDVYLEVIIDGKEETVFEQNITHNLNRMADAVGLYEVLWMPENIDAKTAGDLIEKMEAGLAKLKSNPDYYKTFDAPNGWGKYIDFVPWVEKYLIACRQYPNASVRIRS